MTELSFFNAARTALQSASRVDEVKKIRDKAEAIRAYAKQAGESLEMQNMAGAIKLRAERRLGQLLSDAKLHRGGRPSATGNLSQLATGFDGAQTLAELGIPNRSLSSRWQQVAKIPEPVFEGYIEQVTSNEEEGEELTTAGLMKAAARRNSVDVMGSSESYEWYTPSRYIELARRVMGEIDYDPASSRAANKTVKAKKFVTFEQDGLSRAWKGRVFLNPPYGMGESGKSNQGVWSQRLITQYREGVTKQAVLLVNAATDAGWFQPLWDFPLCFVSHRIRFETSAGEGRQPTHGNVFAYFGKRLAKFKSVFSAVGHVVLPAEGASQSTH